MPIVLEWQNLEPLMSTNILGLPFAFLAAIVMEGPNYIQKFVLYVGYSLN